jgi:glyoxylase-like metal-dependent hydrolase (beta-lactamase superfamily II)
MIGDTYRFKVGAFDCTIFCDIDEHFPAAQIMSSVPVEEIEGELRAYGYDPISIDFSMNLLLIQSPQGRVLVDTGVDRKQDLPNSLKTAGIPPESIDRVILTHCDGDHIGGVAYTEGILTYPKARYSISKTAWEFGLSEAQKSENPNLIARRNLTLIKDRVDIVEPEVEVFPGITALDAPGHKPGHIGLLLESNGERFLHIVDAAHHPIQVIHPEWSPRFDFKPEVSTQTRRALFERANAENLLMMAYHFGFPGVGHVVRRDGKLSWQPINA